MTIKGHKEIVDDEMFCILSEGTHHPGLPGNKGFPEMWELSVLKQVVPGELGPVSHPTLYACTHLLELKEFWHAHLKCVHLMMCKLYFN